MTANSDLQIRDGTPTDRAAILALYPRAFPDEDLRALVTALLDEDEDVVSLVAETGGNILGHAIFTVCGLEGSVHRVALLGPLCVDPGHQRQGIGGALIGAGLAKLQSAGAAQICVLGDPTYYGKFGFKPESRIDPPYPLPKEWRGAWQSRSLTGDVDLSMGRMAVPAPWRDPALWAP
jgi:putative acetyltransferase